jgi:hypothetical protein
MVDHTTLTPTTAPTIARETVDLTVEEETTLPMSLSQKEQAAAKMVAEGTTLDPTKDTATATAVDYQHRSYNDYEADKDDDEKPWATIVYSLEQEPTMEEEHYMEQCLSMTVKHDHCAADCDADQAMAVALAAEFERSESDRNTNQNRPNFFQELIKRCHISFRSSVFSTKL